MLEEHKFPLESFIGGWYINPNICSALIDLFHKGLECYYNQDWVTAKKYFIKSNKLETILKGDKI